VEIEVEQEMIARAEEESWRKANNIDAYDSDDWYPKN